MGKLKVRYEREEREVNKEVKTKSKKRDANRCLFWGEWRWVGESEKMRERESLTEERSLRTTLLAVAVLSGSEDRQLWGLWLILRRWWWRWELPFVCVFT